ncbi:hypothetical protein T06_16548 [Trichinella sp. T6]|nr:hypothetical protein T06_16548 [Trichinella sp. T6]
MRGASPTTRLPTGLVTLAVEVWSRGAQATPSLPGKSSVTTLKEHRARGTLPNNIKTRSSVSVLFAATIWRLTAAGSATGYSAAGPALWGVPIQIVIFNLLEIRIHPAIQQLERAEGDKFVSCFFHECQRPGNISKRLLRGPDEARPIASHPWRSLWDKLPLEPLSGQISQDLVCVDLPPQLTQFRRGALVGATVVCLYGRRAMKRRKACSAPTVDICGTSSKCTAQETMHVIRHTYLGAVVFFVTLTNRGPVKSMPTCANARILKAVLLIKLAFMMTDQAFVEGFHCPTAPSVPVVVASQGIYSFFALIA